MSSVETVILAYRSMLGRDPDPEGLSYWSKLIEQTGDPTAVFAGITTSDEYRVSRTGADTWRAVADEAAAYLGRRPAIVDIGAQAFDGHVYDRLVAHYPCQLIGFDPLEERLVERQQAEEGQIQTLLPYAIGDGREHTLYVNNEDATSSLFPLNVEVTKKFNHLCGLETIETRSIATRRLDDVVDTPRIDLLKLDIQGAELMALKGATQCLARTAVVHCEVEFAPIYAGQSLFAEVDILLRAQGFEFIDFATLKRYHHIAAKGEEQTADRLLWADAVYLRETAEPDALAAQALVAAALYDKLSLARDLIDRIKMPASQ